MSISTIGTAGGPFPSDYRSEVKQLPAGAGKKYEDWSPERKAEVAEARRQSRESLQLAREMEEAAKVTSTEVHDRIAPNVSTLSKEQALQQIESMSELIQSGQADDTKLWTGYGDKTTNNYRQYVYWLQQHVKELEGAQPKSDVKA